MSLRPSHLPDFLNPPINEVVLGVQFAPAPTYQQLHGYDVWQLFRADFPKTEEHPPINPAFETFGRPQMPKLNLEFEAGVMPTRFWFLSASGSELIQFQNDRLLHNWRQVPDASSAQYPRFDTLLARFKSEIERLIDYFAKEHNHKLAFNQCEVSYINNIYFDATLSELGRYFSFLDFGSAEPEDFVSKFRYVVRSDDGRPFARLGCDVATAFAPDDRRLAVMNLTFRGAPADTSVSKALELLTRGRLEIVTRFAELTSKQAHQKWGRTQ